MWAKWRSAGRGRWVAVGVAAVAIAFGVGWATRPASSSPGTVAVGQRAPAWSGASLTGARVSSGAERGRWVVLNFFATWCGPCKTETPQLVRFVATAPASEVQVVGVVFSDSAADARSFAASHSMSWPLITDPDGAIAAAYRVTALPQSFVIRPDGILAARVYGGVTAPGLDRLVGVGGGTHPRS